MILTVTQQASYILLSISLLGQLSWLLKLFRHFNYLKTWLSQNNDKRLRNVKGAWLRFDLAIIFFSLVVLPFHDPRFHCSFFSYNSDIMAKLTTFSNKKVELKVQLTSWISSGGANRGRPPRPSTARPFSQQSTHNPSTVNGPTQQGQCYGLPILGQGPRPAASARLGPIA